MDHVHTHAKVRHIVHDLFQFGAAHIAHPGHPEAEGPPGDHPGPAGEGGIVPQEALGVPVAEHIVVQIGVLRLHGVGHAGGGAHIEMGPGEGVHQDSVARAAHKIGHALVGYIGIGGLGIPLPDGDGLAPLAEGIELLTEAVEVLVGIEIHGLKGIDNGAIVTHGKAHGDGLVLLVHIVVFDLLFCQHFAVQRHRHLPGALPEGKLQPGSFSGDEQFFFRDGDAGEPGEIKDLIVKLWHFHPGIHLQPEGGLTDESDLHQGLCAPIGGYLKGNTVPIRLEGGDIVQKILGTLVGKMGPALFHLQHLAAHNGVVALHIGLFDLGHGSRSFRKQFSFSLPCGTGDCQERKKTLHFEMILFIIGV